MTKVPWLSFSLLITGYRFSSSLPSSWWGGWSPAFPLLSRECYLKPATPLPQSWLRSRLSELVLSGHGALVSRLAEDSRRRAAPLVQQALGALLTGEDLTPGARRACHLLVEAGVCNRVNCWLNANVTRSEYLSGPVERDGSGSYPFSCLVFPSAALLQSESGLDGCFQ